MPKQSYKLEQVAIRMVKERPLASNEPIDSPEAVIPVMQKLLSDFEREVFAVVNLQTDLKPINMNIVSVGALNASLVHPREVIKSVVLSNAAAVMLVHNHPSGRLVPSKEDMSVTKQLMEILNLMQVELLDHVIIGTDDRYYSFREHCTLPAKEPRDWNTTEPVDLKRQKRPEPER